MIRNNFNTYKCPIYLINKTIIYVIPTNFSLVTSIVDKIKMARTCIKKEIYRASNISKGNECWKMEGRSNSEWYKLGECMWEKYGKLN